MYREHMLDTQNFQVQSKHPAGRYSLLFVYRRLVVRMFKSRHEMYNIIHLFTIYMN